MRVLVVEDATRLREIVLRRLREQGYAADGAATASEALAWATASPYDAIVLDLRLPDADGMEVCSRLRTMRVRLSGADADGPRRRRRPCGRAGCRRRRLHDQAVRVRRAVRPAARADAAWHLRRPADLHVGDLRIDPAARTVARGDVDIELTAREFALLEYLMRHRGVALGRVRMIDAVWDGTFQGDPNIVDVYVSRLRDKIDRPFGRATLQTVRGVGYRLQDDAPDLA